MGHESGEYFDLLTPGARLVLGGWIVSGVKAAWLGTPCEGYARARRAPPHSRMPKASRSPMRPLGLPGVCGNGLELLAVSNRLGAIA
eukprot:3459238-Pyramimonas_sp.AAC.1